MPRNGRRAWSSLVTGLGGETNVQAIVALVFSNQRPTPLLPAGNATRILGSGPNPNTRCAAHGPARRKLLMLRPSSMRKANAGAAGTKAGSAALASAVDTSNAH